jgi:hypothetical protein
MAVISGFHVDEYCVPVFKAVVRMLVEQFSAEKITDLGSISCGDLIARVPPKIRGEKASAIGLIPIYRIRALGDDFDEEGNLVSTGQGLHLFFEASGCYLLDLNSSEAHLEESREPHEGAVNCFEPRETGRVKDKYGELEEELKGILYRIPEERIGGCG